MVRENILEFEKKHSKNLTELNTWLEKMKAIEKQPAPKPTHKEHVEVDLGKPDLIEDSKLFKECGSLAQSDPLYRKLNESPVESLTVLKMLSKYLTNKELKERLSFENYMLLETEKVIDKYILDRENKKTLNKIAKLRVELNSLEKSLTKPTTEEQIEKILKNVQDTIKRAK